ncbi:hypothetical protein QVD17_11917 [Tagetes erecta]|uniref:MULE transposase domain-containing protein n=1 Tax=Tagetes erecta TaxID=13708 RepID=A0AAD8L1M3_TARER|nr:hypothetical protein QVD17_11917 [Tagetes erecta]
MADTCADDHAVFTVWLFWSDGESKRNYQVFGDIMSFDAPIAQTAFGKQPDVVVTDQDPTMKKATEEVFIGSRHRLCMWHVMHKLSSKVGVTLCNTTDFKQCICDIVWTDSLTPDEFEEDWHSVIEDFELSNNNWLADIYDMRESLIPTYYRDELMTGLMRTTLRSESEKHFLDKFVM